MSRQLGELPDRTEQWAEVNPPPSRAAQKKKYVNAVNFLNLPFTVGTTATQVLQANRSRVSLIIQNKSASNMHFGFGGAVTTYSGLLLEPGQSYEPYIAPYSSIFIIGSAASLDGVIVEGVSG